MVDGGDGMVDGAMGSGRDGGRRGGVWWGWWTLGSGRDGRKWALVRMVDSAVGSGGRRGGV